MELQTVSQVSKTLGISARMLRYYEQCGLVKSLRKEGYSYRVYDIENIQRLQQIVILRKLQISVKQICIILNNPYAATIINVFKENISELQNEIKALETIKSALEIFVAKIEEISSIRLNINLLTNDSVIRIAESLSLIQKNVKENKIMEELNEASKNLEKLKEKFVRVIRLPKATVACVNCKINQRYPDNPWAVYNDAKKIINEFIESVDLLKIKPDFRYFINGNSEITTCNIMVTIPDDLEVLAPLTKDVHSGGLYAAYTNTPDNFDGWKVVEAWVDSSDDYEWLAREPRLEEYFNPNNIYGLKNNESEYYDFLLPIEEINKLTEEKKDELNNRLKNTEKLITQNQSIEIDLTTMVKYGELDLSYKNGLMEIKVDGDKSGMTTQESFKLPLKIELRAKTNDKNIRIKYGKGIILFNWEHIRTTLLIGDVESEEIVFHKKCGGVPINKFVDIEWILGKEEMAVKVNDKIKHLSSDYSYIKAFKENPEYVLSSAVTVTTAFGSTITVERLCITEI